MNAENCKVEIAKTWWEQDWTQVYALGYNTMLQLNWDYAFCSPRVLDFFPMSNGFPFMSPSEERGAPSLPPPFLLTVAPRLTVLFALGGDILLTLVSPTHPLTHSHQLWVMWPSSCVNVYPDLQWLMRGVLPGNTGVGHFTEVRCSEQLSHSCCLVTCLCLVGCRQLGCRYLTSRTDIYSAPPPLYTWLLISYLTLTGSFPTFSLSEAAPPILLTFRRHYAEPSINRSLVSEVQFILLFLMNSLYIRGNWNNMVSWKLCVIPGRMSCHEITVNILWNSMSY